MALSSLKGLVSDQLTATETELENNQDALGLNHVTIGRDQGTWDHPAAFIFAGPGDARILKESNAPGVNLWAVPVATTVAVLDHEGAVDDRAVGLAEDVGEHLTGKALGNAHKTKPVRLGVGGARSEGNAWETIAASHIEYHVRAETG